MGRINYGDCRTAELHSAILVGGWILGGCNPPDTKYIVVNLPIKTSMPSSHSQFNHRVSHRLKGYDYSFPGLYFITICCHNKISRFGEIIKQNMVLNEFGAIAHEKWLETAITRPQVTIDEFIIMPNHMHAILSINDSVSESPIADSPRQPDKTESKNSFRSPSQTLGAMVRGYKGAVRSAINKLGYNEERFWQSNFHDNIIRNEIAYLEIKEYVINNPNRWQKDRFYNI